LARKTNDFLHDFLNQPCAFLGKGGLIIIWEIAQGLASIQIRAKVFLSTFVLGCWGYGNVYSQQPGGGGTLWPCGQRGAGAAVGAG
jgi:hypothetical protein